MSIKQGWVKLQSILSFALNVKRETNTSCMPVLIIDEGRLINKVILE